MSSSVIEFNAGFLSLTSALSGAGGVTSKSSSGIVVETPGLQGVVPRRSFGSAISRGTDSNGGILRRFEVLTINEDFDRFNLTELVELFEEVKEDFGVCFKMPPPRMIQFRDLFERSWGWQRFFPVYNPRYLEEFYWRNVKASGVQSETTLGRQPTICATAGVNLVYLGRKKVTGSTQSDAATGQQHADSASANHNLACADHDLSDSTTGQHHANSACTNHDMACADHNLAIADHNLAIILVYLCCKKEAELVLKWKEQRLQYLQKKKKENSQKKQKKTEGLRKDAGLVSKWKKQRLQYLQKKQQQKNSQKKQKKKTKELCLLSPEIRLSTSIQKEIISLVLPTKKTPIPIIPPVIYDCINCIMKEAELILEWLRLGFGPYGLHHDLSHGIRNRVFRLIKKYSRADPCSASVATCAVLLGITKECVLVCEKLRQDNDILSGENNLSLDICTSALDMLDFGMDEYVLKRARIDGFCYRIHFDPASADVLTWHEKEWQNSKAQDTELGKVHVDELINENHSTKNKLEEDVTVNSIARGSHDLSKESHSTRNKLEKDVTANGLTRGSHESIKEKVSTKNKEEDVTVNSITTGSHDLSKESHSTRNKLEKDVTANGLTRGSHESIKENVSTKNKEEDVTVNSITTDSHDLSKESHSTRNKLEKVVTANGLTRGGSHESIKENLSTKNKLEEDVTVSGITSGSHKLRKSIQSKRSWLRL